jgi:hypothetical protein
VARSFQLGFTALKPQHVEKTWRYDAGKIWKNLFNSGKTNPKD